MEVVTELYVENHLRPVQAWAHSLGLQLRIQPYGLQTDAIYKAALLDIPEGESLGFKNLDDFRCLAGGRDMGGGLLLSNEAGGTAGGAYATTWDDTLKKLVTQYAAGVNQAVFHGFAYAERARRLLARLRGLLAVQRRYGLRRGVGAPPADVGPRARCRRISQPCPAGVADRCQQERRRCAVAEGLRGLRPRRVLVHRRRASPSAGPTCSSARACWACPAPWCARAGSRREGPAFKALLVDGDVMIGREHTLQLDVAHKLIGYAREGLRIIVIGDWSDGHVPGLPRTGDNERLRGLLTELLALPTVFNVPDRPDVPRAIAALGLTRDVEYAQSSMLLHSHRADEDADYYFFANDAVSVKGSTGSAIDHDVTLTTRHRDVVPYRLDAWTGTITPCAAYTRLDDGRIRLRVTLARGASHDHRPRPARRPGARSGAALERDPERGR